MPNTKPIVIAVAKGYLWKEGLALLNKCGITFESDLSDSRKLSTTDTTGMVTLLQVRSTDVPAYVENGGADLGMVGKDVLLEQSPNVVEILDLKYAGCRLVLAGTTPIDPKSLPHNTRVATKYWECTKTYFKAFGLKVIPIKLYGAIELAPTMGIADIICDLTATGTTLRDNHLVELGTVFESTARLIANTVSSRSHYDTIKSLSDQIQTHL
ncbi:ATP phosphoribosyltransferase [bacterium]|jgi:ATP phosphoribosyltransferase|nr:ATP phosphoribosyltransferase [bacterium]